jgi:ketosteroid isomerase-like protein
MNGRAIFIFSGCITLLSCFNRKPNKMQEVDTNQIAKEVKNVLNSLTRYSEEAQLDLFLNGYDKSPSFLHFSSDGKMRNYEELKEICTGYYTALKEQKVSTLMEKVNVVDEDLAIVGWTGNIVAQFKNGDSMIMNNYSITNVLKKIDGEWKIIHSHESALPPVIIKKG